MKKRVCLLGLGFETGNMGVNALTFGTIRTIVKYDSGIPIHLLDYGKIYKKYKILIDGKVKTVERNLMRFSKNIFLQNNISNLIIIAIALKLMPKNFKEKILKKNELIRIICESDHVISLAGGDSFSDIYGIRRFLYVSLPQILVLILGKKLILYPQTIGPFKNKIVKNIASYIIKNAKYVYSRDLNGYEYCRRLLKRSKRKNSKKNRVKNDKLCNDKINKTKVRFCYDVGFILEKQKPDINTMEILNTLKNKEKNLIGINVSGLLYEGGYTKDNMFNLKMNYKELIKCIIENIMKIKDTSIILVPHVFGNNAKNEDDLEACKNVYKEMSKIYNGRIDYIKNELNQGEIKYVIGCCEFFIGSRMHSCIGALSNKIPAIAIAYSKKFIGVLNTIGLKDLVIDPRELDTEEIVNRIIEVYKRKEFNKKVLDKIIPKVNQRIMQLYGDVKG